MLPELSQNWAKDLKVLGPMGMLSVISLLLILVVTGIIPTPLMNALTTIAHVSAQQDQDTVDGAEMLRVAQQSCKFIAKMAKEDPVTCIQKP